MKKHYIFFNYLSDGYCDFKPDFLLEEYQHLVKDNGLNCCFDIKELNNLCCCFLDLDRSLGKFIENKIVSKIYLKEEQGDYDSREVLLEVIDKKENLNFDEYNFFNENIRDEESFSFEDGLYFFYEFLKNKNNIKQ